MTHLTPFGSKDRNSGDMAKDLPRRRSAQSFKAGFAGRVVRARLAEGRTQQNMAECIGIPYRAYQRMETGERIPEPADLRLFSGYFDWPLPELLVECGYLDEPIPVPEPGAEDPEMAMLPDESRPLEQTFVTRLGPVKIEIIVRVSRA